MKQRVLGRTGLEVGELSLGAAFITRGDDGFDAALPLVRRALELGMSLADTSADYGDSEKALGHALHEIGKPCIVSTKLGPRSGGPFDPKDKACLRRIAEESLQILHRDVIDILMIHEPDRPGQFDWYNDGVSFEGPVVELLQELKQEGMIKYTGLGGTTAYALARVAQTRFRVREGLESPIRAACTSVHRVYATGSLARISVSRGASLGVPPKNPIRSDPCSSGRRPAETTGR